MNWKFWQKSGEGGSSREKVVKLSKPKELPGRLAIYLITQMNEDPDWTRCLKWVVRHNPDNKQLMEFKIFSPSDATYKNLIVSDYNSLNNHPGMVLFEGLFDKETGIVWIR